MQLNLSVVREYNMLAVPKYRREIIDVNEKQ